MTDSCTLGTGHAQITLRRRSLDQFVDPSSIAQAFPAEEKCTIEALQRALSGLEHVRVVSASINRSGEFQPPTASYLFPYHESGSLPALPKVTNLPDYCDVRLSYSDPANNAVEVTVCSSSMPSCPLVEIQPIGRGTTHDLNGSNGNVWSVLPGS